MKLAIEWAYRATRGMVCHKAIYLVLWVSLMGRCHGLYYGPLHHVFDRGSAMSLQKPRTAMGPFELVLGNLDHLKFCWMKQSSAQPFQA